MSEFTITYPEVLVSGNTTWNGSWVIISPDKNFAWNLPAAELHPVMNGLTVSNQTCTYTSTPSTNVSVKVQEADYCTGYLPIYGNGTPSRCEQF
jgi:hypothetical protein